MPVFGFDENKCKVEVATKEAVENNINKLNAEVIKKGNIYNFNWKPPEAGEKIESNDTLMICSGIEGLSPDNTVMLSAMYGNTYFMTNVYKKLNVFVKFESGEPVIIFENNTDAAITITHQLRVVFLKYA